MVGSEVGVLLCGVWYGLQVNQARIYFLWVDEDMDRLFMNDYLWIAAM